MKSSEPPYQARSINPTKNTASTTETSHAVVRGRRPLLEAAQQGAARQARADTI
jgi:hypothetical protein